MTSTAACVPSGIDDVTAEWLDRCFARRRVSAGFVGRQCRSCRTDRQDSGFSSLLYRVQLSGQSGSAVHGHRQAAGHSEARGAMDMLGGYRRELSFYQRVAGRAPMGTPHVLRRQDGGRNDRFRAGAGGSAVLGERRPLGRSVDAAGADRIARSGRPARLVDEPANVASGTRFSEPGHTVGPRRVLPGVRTGMADVPGACRPTRPDAVARYAERFAEYAPKALEALSRRPMLLHGDIRADNLFFAGDTMKVVDFQFASRGAGASDIAYLVSQGLPTEVRADTTSSWCASTSHELAGRGVTDYSFDEAWRSLPPRDRLLHASPGDHPRRLGHDAGTLTRVVPKAHRTGGGGDRRHRRAGGVRMSTASEPPARWSSCTTSWCGTSATSTLAEELIADT